MCEQTNRLQVQLALQPKDQQVFRRPNQVILQQVCELYFDCFLRLIYMGCQVQRQSQRIILSAMLPRVLCFWTFSFCGVIHLFQRIQRRDQLVILLVTHHQVCFHLYLPVFERNSLRQSLHQQLLLVIQLPTVQQVCFFCQKRIC